MRALCRDLRFGLRLLRRAPAFTVAAVVTLALGIGANTAIFSVVKAVLLEPPPYRDPDRLVVVWEHNVPRNRPTNVVATVNFRAWQRLSSSFAGLEAATPAGFTLAGDPPERISALAVTPGFFGLLGVTPSQGRAFAAEEGIPGRGRVVVLTDALWRHRFGADPTVVGSTLALDGEPHTVIGVLPVGFRLPPLFGREDATLFVPLALAPEPEYQGRSLLVLARLAAGVAVARAQADMVAIAQRLEAEHEYNRGWSANVVPLREQIVGALRLPLLLLLAAVALVLLIACANVANLLLARAVARRRELAVRAALGAGRARIAVQLLTEGILLVALAGAGAFLLAGWGIDALLTFAPPGVDALAKVEIDGGVLGFALAICAVVGAVTSLAPMIMVSRTDVQTVLKEQGSGTVGSGGRVRSALVAAEVALALVLTIGAGLATRSLQRLTAVDPGFDARGVTTARVTLGPGYQQPERRGAVHRELAQRLASRPGVAAVSATAWRPLDGPGIGTSFWAADRPPPAPRDRPAADILVVTPGYFAAMGIPLRRGRDFGPTDGPRAPEVVIVNETLARIYWPEGDAIGRRVTVNIDELRTAEIVGVAGDIRPAGLSIDPRGQIYFPYDRIPRDPMYVIVRGPDPDAAVAAIRAELATLVPGAPVDRVADMETLVARSLASPRFLTLLLAAFAALALALSLVGIYGVVTLAVTERTREIALRMALGAGRGRVLALVVGSGMRMVLAGIIVGLVASLASSRLMASLLYRVGTTDPLTFAVVTTAIGVVALAASVIPAWRAMRLDPMANLRSG